MIESVSSSDKVDPYHCHSFNFAELANFFDVMANLPFSRVSVDKIVASPLMREVASKSAEIDDQHGTLTVR